MPLAMLPAMDLNVEPNHETEAWSETRWNGCWNPEQGVGLYTHMGRFRKDLEIWWAQTVAYLPDGRLAVDRSWGRTPDARSVRSAPSVPVRWAPRARPAPAP